MNLVGKIFVFMIFCMSVVFMSFAVVVYATHTNWRDEVLRKPADVKGDQTVGLKFQLESAQEKYKKLETEKDDKEKKLMAQVATLQQNLAKAEMERTVLVAQNQEAQKNYSEVLALHQGALDKVAVEQKKLNSLRAENEVLRGDIRTARGSIDDWFGRTVVLTEQNHNVRGDIVRARERQEQVTNELVRAEDVLKKLGATKDTVVDGNKSAEIDGVVTGVRKSGDDTYVQISVGSDDTVQVGYSLEVYRGGKYVGQIVIVRTEPDKAVGKVTRALAPVEARDQVKSRRSLLTSG